MNDGGGEIINLRLMGCGLWQRDGDDVALFSEPKGGAMGAEIITEGGVFEDDVERVPELAAVRIPGGMKMDGRSTGMIPERVHGHGKFVLDRAARVNGGRLPKPPERHIHVMNVHIENYPAAFRRTHQPSVGTPLRARARSMERRVHDPSIG